MIAAARTGRDPIRSIAVTTRDHANRGMRSITSASVRIFHTVTTKLIDATIDEAPAKCREKMAMSTAGLAWPTRAERGG